MLKRCVVLAGLGVLVAAVPGWATAQTFPDKPLTLIVPWPPGGPADIVGRGIAEAVKKHLPQPVAVVNRPGGAGTIGMGELVTAKPDGYKLVLGALAISAVQPHLTPLPFKTPSDYLPVMNLVTLQVILFVRSDAPWKQARELLDHLRANPGKVRIGIPGIGSVPHLDVAQLEVLAKVKFTEVPFEGPQQVTALLGGHVEAAVAHPAAVIPHVQAGKIRVIGVFQPERNPLFPGASTFRELGYDVTLGVYYFLALPKGTPAPAARTLHDAFKKAMEEPSFVALMKKGQIDVVYRGPEELTKDLWASYEQCGKLTEHLGLKK